MKRFLLRWLARWRRTTGEQPTHADAAAVHDMAPMLDCDEVMRQLWDYLDGELTPVRMAAIRAHLELCKRCYPQFEFERSFLDAVARAAREHSNLDRLRARLVERLRERGMTEA